jgi:hypothetical protein
MWKSGWAADNFPYVIGYVEVHGSRSMATDLDIATVGTKRLYRIDYREIEPLQIRSDKIRRLEHSPLNAG